MNNERWVQSLKTAFAAVAAGGRMVPLGDNGRVIHALAVAAGQGLEDANRPRPASECDAPVDGVRRESVSAALSSKRLRRIPRR